MKKVFGTLVIIFAMVSLFTGCSEEILGNGIVVERPRQSILKLAMPAGDTINWVHAESDSLWFNTQIGDTLQVFLDPWEVRTARR